MKKTLALLLALLMAASALLSCAQNNPESGNTGSETTFSAGGETTVEEETEPSYLETLGKKDFGGATFVIVASQQGTIPAFATEITGEAVNDAFYKRNELINHL